jgi:phospho-N-acetylmuramoyl-pentapeptide-transferase
VTNILIAGTVGLLLSLFGTPLAIKSFKRRGWGQLIREEGPKAHYEKRGTPTMGGLVMVGATVCGYALGHIGTGGYTPPRTSGVLAIGTIVALAGLGFLDDMIKIRKSRSLGLRSRAKFLGQIIIAIVFAIIAVHVVHIHTDISFFRPTALHIGILFYVWVFLMMAASSNGVNLTDGLDGLAVGSAAQVLAAFVVIAFWQFRHVAFYDVTARTSDPFELALVASALFGSCAGFLWWNTPPARIFMGDTGSLMLGGSMAVLAVLLNTQLLLLILGGLYVVETISVIAQVAIFKKSGRRIFLMAPIHNHFELAGWAEVTVVVRFWVLSGLSVAFGLGLFYADFLSKGGVK